MFENGRGTRMELTVDQFAALVRYVCEAEKAKNHEGGWKVPAIKALKTLKGMSLKEAKDLVEAVDPGCDPVVKVINQSFGVY